MGARDHLGSHGAVRGQGAAHQGWPGAERAIPQPEGRDHSPAARRNDLPRGLQGWPGPRRGAVRRGRVVPQHARRDPPDGSGDRLRRARGEHPAPGRRRTTDRPLRSRGDERAVKVIIPLAGKGTRLRPHTHTVPKPMLKVCGKPVMDYVLDDVRKLGDVSEVIYITGHLKEAVEAHARTAYSDLPATFIEQKVQDGTAGAVALAKPHVSEPVLIIFVDTIFDADLGVIKTSPDDGIIWTKEVEDYQRFGVVVTDANGHMTKIVEKPKMPISKRANIGLYYIRDWKLLYEGIDHVLKSPQNQGEYYLTDAFQYMIDHGAKLKVLDVAGWYDAGKIDTLLDTNRVMLEKGLARRPKDVEDCTIIDPVYIEDDVVLTGSTVGPNVCVLAGSRLLSCTVSNTLIGARSLLARCTLSNSLIGNRVVLEGVKGEVTVGDDGEVRSRA
ncbi:MAG: nucleotidyltransferase [Gemmatimonas sp.]|nr:nucleotidyltransferase [Gemmatimonas sp.]